MTLSVLILKEITHGYIKDSILKGRGRWMSSSQYLKPTEIIRYDEFNSFLTILSMYKLKKKGLCEQATMPTALICLFFYR